MKWVQCALFLPNGLYDSKRIDDCRGGYLVQKTLRGCAANMGSKISLLVCEWPLIKCKIWYMILMDGSIFQKLVILFKIWLKIGPIGILMGYFFLKNFSWKTGICMGLLSNPVAAHPYQNQTWVPPRDDCICETLWHRPKQSELGRERDYFLAYNAIFICNSLSIAICFISIWHLVLMIYFTFYVDLNSIHMLWKNYWEHGKSGLSISYW